MADKQVFEINYFSNSLQFFEYHVRSIASKTLQNRSNSNEILESGFHSKFRTNVCKFGALTKTKSKRSCKNTADLIVKISGGKLETEEIIAMRDNMYQSPTLKQYLLTGNIDQFGDIHFYLNQKTFLKDVIELIISCGFKYGQKKETLSVNQQFLINNGNILMDCIDEDDISVGQLRTALLRDHIIKILHQNSSNSVIYNPGINISSKSDKLSTNDILNVLGISCNKPQPTSIGPSEFQTVKKSLESRLLKSKYKTKDDERGERPINWNELLENQDHVSVNGQATSATMLGEQELTKHSDLPLSENVCLNDVDSEVATRSCGNIELNLFKFIEDLKKAKDNKGDHLPVAYDKNLKEVKVSLIWDDILNLEMLDHETRLENIKDENRRIIHVCGQDKKIKFQKIALAWRMLTKSSLAEKQIFLCHGSAAFFNKKTCLSDCVSVKELMRIRTKQVKHSYFMKYGPIVDDEKWKVVITKMAIAVVKLEILFAPMKSQVKLDVTDNNDCPSSCRQALFVLYNCARLAKIIEHYNNAVDKEVYPALPDINEVDFSHLKDETEWNLFMKYVVSYPDIVANVTQSLEESSMVSSFNSNKIAQFLVSLSQDISAYYSRVHILGEPRCHLFPVMFARLYLIKVLYQVMQNALQLLSIETVDQM